MPDANNPITIEEALSLPSIGINPQFITFTNVTMESDKFICVHETSPQNSVVIIDMSMPMQSMRRPINAESTLMNPISRILALKAQLPGTTDDHLQIFNIETKAIIKSHQMSEKVTHLCVQVVFWKWITPKMLGLVTVTSVYHWSIEADSEPVEMFYRTPYLSNNQIIDYKCDPSEKWLVLIGIEPGSPERPQLVLGNMQLFSIDQQRSQSLRAHAALFATFEVPGNENPSVLISFATKSFNAGHDKSKLHVVQLGAQPGKPSFTKKHADLYFPPHFEDGYPVGMQLSNKYGLIYVITKLGLLFVFDLETATAVYRNRISPDPIFLTTEASSVGGFYAVNRRGQVLLATVNKSTIMTFVSQKLNNPELAISLAKRGNLPGVENLIVQRFQELFAQTKYKEAAELAAESPQGILRTRDTFAKFRVAKEYCEELGVEACIKLFEQFKLYEGLYFFLGPYLSSSEDPEIHFKYIEAAAKIGQIKEVERVTRESKFFDAEKTKKFLMEAKLPDERPLINVCDRLSIQIKKKID